MSPETSRTDQAIRALARRATWEQLQAGADGERIKNLSPAECDEREAHVRSAREGLTLVMILRRIRSAAPDLLDEILDQYDLATHLTELGLLIHLERFLEEAGGTSADLHFLRQEDALGVA